MIYKITTKIQQSLQKCQKPTFHMDQSALAKPPLSDVTFAHDEMGVDNQFRTSGVTAVLKVSVCFWTATNHSTSLWVACMRISCANEFSHEL